MTRLNEQVTSGIAPLDSTYTEIAAPQIVRETAFYPLFQELNKKEINLVCRLFLTTFLATKQLHNQNLAT
jgi:hypothetical protein